MCSASGSSLNHSVTEWSNQDGSSRAAPTRAFGARCSVVASRHIRLRSQAFRRGSQEVLGFFATVPARVLSASTHVLFGCREDKICKWTFAWKGISLGASVQRAHTSEQTEVRSICEWSRWFERIFDRSKHSGSALDRLFMIQWGSHSVAEYAIEFGTLAEEAAWNETALLNVFCGGLSGSVCWGAAAKGFGGTNRPRYGDRYPSARAALRAFLLARLPTIPSSSGSFPPMRPVMFCARRNTFPTERSPCSWVVHAWPPRRGADAATQGPACTVDRRVITSPAVLCCQKIRLVSSPDLTLPFSVACYSSGNLAVGAWGVTAVPAGGFGPDDSFIDSFIDDELARPAGLTPWWRAVPPCQLSLYMVITTNKFSSSWFILHSHSFHTLYLLNLLAL